VTLGTHRYEILIATKLLVAYCSGKKVYRRGGGFCFGHGCFKRGREIVEAGVLAHHYLHQFGLYASPTATVIATFVCVLSIAGALFLILDLDQSFQGWIQIPSAPLRNALIQLGQ